MEKEIVSIIVPCYNQAQYLSEAIESVLVQTYTNWECIIINDGSTDNTEVEALKWSKLDDRVKYLKKNNGGLSSARNYGIRNSSGAFILPLDADDKIGREYLELAIEKFQQSPEIKVVYCRAELFGSENGEWKLPPYKFGELLLFNTIFCSALYRRVDYDTIKGYDEKLKYGGEDWEFWITLLKNGGDVFKLETVQFYYRKKEVSMHTELIHNKEKDQYTHNIIFQNHFDLYQRFYGVPLVVYKKAYELENELRVINDSRITRFAKSFWKLRKKIGI